MWSKNANIHLSCLLDLVVILTKTVLFSERVSLVGTKNAVFKNKRFTTQQSSVEGSLIISLVKKDKGSRKAWENVRKVTTKCLNSLIATAVAPETKSPQAAALTGIISRKKQKIERSYRNEYQNRYISSWTNSLSKT